MFIKIPVKILGIAVAGFVIGKSRQKVLGGVVVGVDGFFGIYVILGFIVADRVKEIGEFRIGVSDGCVFAFTAATVARCGNHGGSRGVKDMLVSERFVVVIQSLMLAEKPLFVLGQIGRFFGVSLFRLTQLLAAEFFGLLLGADIVGVGYIGFKIVVVVKIVFKSHLYPPFPVMGSHLTSHK